MSFENDRQFLDGVQPRRGHNGAQAIHPYFGKLDPALAEALITLYSSPYDVVLDPFCGSATVLYEALLLERSAVGWDSSPLAILIAQAKLSGINKLEVQQLEQIAAELEIYGHSAHMFRQAIPDTKNIPDMARVRDITFWFTQNSLSELAFLKEFIESKRDSLLPVSYMFSRIAFSRIITMASNQQGESSYRRIEKPDFPGRVIDLYIDALHNMSNIAKAFTTTIGNNDTQRHFIERTGSILIRWGDRTAELFCHDSRAKVKPDTMTGPLADLVVTSPPYLMAWDYGLYHKFRFYWLGFDLDAYEQTEIGRHLRRKKDDIEQYESDMVGAFLAMGNALKPNATIALINAPSVVYGREVDTNVLLRDCALAAGWQLIDCVTSLDIPGPHHGMYASLKIRGANAPGRKGKKEHVLTFRRTQMLPNNIRAEMVIEK